MPAHRFAEENGSAAIRSAGFTSEVNLREHVTHMSLSSANKAATHHQKSKTGVTVVPQKGLMSSN